MFENRWLRYTLYGASAVVVSEVFYRIYRIISNIRISKLFSSSDDEIADVIWTNELTQSCASFHHFHDPTTANGEDGQAATSPSAKCKNIYCASNNVGRLITLIDNAKYSIDLAMYTFTSHELSQAFMRALRRGLIIRIISDKEMVYSSGSQIIALTKEGIPVRCPSTTMLMHHKFCILDGEMRSVNILSKSGKKYDTNNVKGIIMSGSLNWTMQGFGGNWENILISSNKQLVNNFEKEYERMWKAFDIKFENTNSSAEK